MKTVFGALVTLFGMIYSCVMTIVVTLEQHVSTAHAASIVLTIVLMCVGIVILEREDRDVD